MQQYLDQVVIYRKCTQCFYCWFKFQLNLFDDDMYFKWIHIYADIDPTNKTDKAVLDKLRNSDITLAVDLVIAIAASNTTKTDSVWFTK